MDNGCLPRPLEKENAMKRTLSTLCTASLLFLSACGGGGSSPAATATGYFIDSPVAGLSYTSGGQTGITGSDGSFTYEVGQPITFKLGSMVLGTVTVDKNKRIFPVDLVNGANDETHANVSLMAQVLQSLDSDGDPSNGITISNQTRAAIATAINLANVDPQAALTLIQSALGNTSLVTPTQARDHIRTNLIKEYAGTWTGTYSGGDRGPCSVTINTTGNITGSCTSQGFGNTPFSINGTVSSSGDSTVGNATTGASFTGTYQRYGEVNGTWTNNTLNISGTFTLKRQAS